MDLQLPDWLTPKTTPWQSLALGAQVGAQIAQARYRNQALRVQVEQQAQQDVLQMRRLALQEQQQTVMNQARLNEMEEAAAATRDAPRLAHFMKTGELSEPLENPKSYGYLAQIQLAKSRTKADQSWEEEERGFWKQFSMLKGDDKATLKDMLRESNGTITGDIYRYAGEAFEKVKTDVVQEPIYGPDGRFLGMAVTGKGTKLITNTGRMADVDKMEYTAAKKELAAIDKQLNDPIASRFFKPEQKTAIEKSRAALHQKIGSILSRYDNDDDTEQPAAPTAPDPSDPLGVLK